MGNLGKRMTAARASVEGKENLSIEAVSYTHLTLPTILLV